MNKEANEDVIDNLALHYKEDLPSPELIQIEYKRWVMHLQDPDVSTVKNLTDALDICDAVLYPNINTLLKIGATLPVTTCECERSFSTLRRLNNYLRRTQTPQRLDALALINIYNDKQFDKQKIVDCFAKLHPRKMELSSVLASK